MKKLIERVIEQELYDYKENKKHLVELEEEIYYSSPNIEQGMPRGTDCGNPTENKALKKMTSRAILEMERRTKAVEKVLLLFKEDETMMSIIELKYFSNLYTVDGILEKLNISRSTYFYKRKKLLEELKLFLGF